MWCSLNHVSISLTAVQGRTSTSKDSSTGTVKVQQLTAVVAPLLETSCFYCLQKKHTIPRLRTGSEPVLSQGTVIPG